MKKKDASKRVSSFWNSNTPLVSGRVRVILSSREDSQALAQAVRKNRITGGRTTFNLTKSTLKKIESL